MLFRNSHRICQQILRNLKKKKKKKRNLLERMVEEEAKHVKRKEKRKGPPQRSHLLRWFLRRRGCGAVNLLLPTVRCMTKLFPFNGFFFWGDLILLEREREAGDPGKKSTLRKCGGNEGCLLRKCFFYVVCAYLTQMNQPLYIWFCQHGWSFIEGFVFFFFLFLIKKPI
jgi:hypothetical protein